MSKKDLESLEDDILQILEDNFASKVVEINTEKADAISISNIPRDQWFDSANEKVFNLTEYAVYGFGDVTGIIPAEDPGEITYSFEIAFTDMQDTVEGKKKALRYGRLLREILEENAHKLSYTSTLEMTVFAPVGIKDLRGTPIKVVGVEIKTAMG